MSEINDALKRVRQTSLPNKPNEANAFTPLPLHAAKSPTTFGWMIPAFVVALVVAAIFFIGWAATHRHVQKIIVALNPVAPARSAAEIAPAVEPIPAPIRAPAPAPTVATAPVLPKLPKLQGIFYSATAPTVILDGKTVGVGDKFGEYHVQHISQDTVTLIAADGREIKIGMNR